LIAAVDQHAGKYEDHGNRKQQLQAHGFLPR
jgi:hypothetical protein